MNAAPSIAHAIRLSAFHGILGSRVLFQGVAHGRRVIVAIDRHESTAFMDALARGEQPVAHVEDWQILR
jgi:hypothetical protein